MKEQDRVVSLYSQGLYSEADRLCVLLQHDGLASPLLHAMRGFNALHMGRPYRCLAWLRPVVNKLDEPFAGQAYINMCRAFGELNRFDEAIKAGREAVRRAAQRPNAHINLAAALAFSGQAKAAIEAIEPLRRMGLLSSATGLLNWLAQSVGGGRQILLQWLEKEGLKKEASFASSLPANSIELWSEARPEKAKILFQKALQFFNRGDLGEARKFFLHALKQHPLFFNAKLALVQLSRMESDSLSALKELDALELEHPDVTGNEKGQLLAERAKNLSSIEMYSKAENYAIRATELLPNDGDLWNALGFYQIKCQKFQKAERSLKKALKCAPAHQLAMNNLATLYLDRGEDRLACDVYEQQLQHDPESVPSLLGMAHVFQVRGDFNSVRSYLRRALKIDPSDPYVARLAADSDPEAVDEFMLKELAAAGEKIDPEASCPPNKAVANSQLMFALADLHSTHKEYEKAEKNFFKANRIQSFLRPYKKGQHERLKKRLEVFFSRVDGVNIKDQKDLEKDGPLPVMILGMPRSGSTLLERILCSHTDVATGGEMKDFNRELEATDCFRYMTSGSQQWVGLAAKTFNGSDLDAAAQRYRNALGRVDKQASYVIDKMPGNFWWIGFALRMLPDLIILHSCRDARSTCLSCFQQNFSEGQSFSFNPSTLGHYYSLYSGIMRYWHRQFPGRILDVRYEALVTEMAEEMERVLNFCGLSWQSSMERFYEQKGLVKTASLRQVRQPLYTSSLEKWKKYPRFVKELGSVDDYKPVVSDIQK